MPAARSKVKVIFVSVLALSVSACQTTGTRLAVDADGALATPQGDFIRREPSAEIRQVHQWLLDGEHERASKWLNQALRHNIDDAELQFLNGLAYHLMSQTDVSQRDLAAEGYRLSLKFDNTQWAPHYFLGVLAMEAREYNRALRHFSDAALHNPDSASLLKDMAAAAYLGRQPDLAAGLYEQLLSQAPDNDQYRADYALSLAALDLHQKAAAQLDRIGNPARRAFARKRLEHWRRFHQNAKTAAATTTAAADGFIKAQYDDEYSDEYSDEYGEEGGEGYDEFGDGGGIQEVRSEQQVILDVVFIRSEESSSTSRGINLLNGLHLLYTDGIDIAGTDGIFGTDIPKGKTSRATRTIKFGNTDGSDEVIRYSLNIINSASNRSEVLARPSLTVTDGETSRFFSGRNILGVVPGGGDFSNTQVDRDIGVTLSVSPLFLDSGRIQLNINAQRTFLTTPSTSIQGFQDEINTSKTEINTTVVMDFGETLVLSGLSEKETGNERSGVPFLQDIPGVQYFFSKRETSEFQKSVMVLVTPRLPAYTYQPPGVAASKDGGGTSVDEFKSYYQDWFKPYPNWASVFNHLEHNRLYREFRTSDVTLEQWESRETRESRLRDAIDSLYF